MINRFKTSIVRDYILNYEIPKSFYDKDIIKYLKDKCFDKIKEYKEDIDKSWKEIAMGTDVKYHLLRKYFIENYPLKDIQEDLRILDMRFSKKKTAKSIDIDKLKEEVKCEDLLGKPDRIDGKRLWYKLRNERTASCCVYTETNSFYDFGDANSGGSVIDLFMKLNDCDHKVAIKELSRN